MQRGKQDNRPVTASEIACWAYCPEQWRLQYGLGLQAQNQAAMDRGSRHHAAKAVAERIAGAALALGRLLMLAGLLALLLWVLWR
jgi:PD-(D/E)XK nuclease superfamily